MSLRPGNQKLGVLFHQWSIPAGDTCPGRSDLCFDLCYARTSRFLLPGVRRAHGRNLDTSRSENFVSWMNEEIRRALPKIVRIHVAGDFYSPEYTSAWFEITRQNRRTSFLTYTRSWRDDDGNLAEDFLVPLHEMARSDNVFLWFSCDRETGPPPEIDRVQRAYMMVDDEDEPEFPVDLVFRVNSSTPMKYTPGGTLCCPYDNAVTRTTCSHCGLCWSRKAIPRRNHADMAEAEEGRREEAGSPAASPRLYDLRR